MKKLLRALKQWTLLIAIVVGAVGHSFFSQFTWLAPWLLASMLLLTFCNISPRDLRFHPLHLILMSLQIVMSLGLYALTLPWHPAIAQGVCMAALTPTATAAAIITGMLGGSVAFLAAYAFLSNLAIVVLAVNSGAYLCEIFRAGIQSVPKGQFEASRSLGMTGPQTMFYVIIPQTIRRVIPTMTSEFILLYKDTSLLAAVGVMELMLYSRSIVSLTGNMTPYIVAACFYLIVTLPLIRVVGNLEKRLALADSGGTAPKKKRRKNRRGAFTQMREEIAVSTEQAAEVLQGQERLEAHLDDGSEPADMDQALDELQDGIALDAQITDADERGGLR